MKFSHKLSDAVHILAYVEIYADGDLTSAAIANSIEANPSMVRRLMSSLAKAGLLQTQPGAVAPQLTRSAAAISLLDIYLAVEANPHLLHVDEKTNPQCVVGGNIQETLNVVYDRVQHETENYMSEFSLAAIIDDILEREKTRQR